MTEIWKFKLTGPDKLIKAPVEKWLTVQEQNGSLCVWAIVDHDTEAKDYYIYTLGTGWPVSKIVGDYVGTVQEGAYVWHVFAAQVSESDKENLENRMEMEQESTYAS